MPEIISDSLHTVASEAGNAAWVPEQAKALGGLSFGDDGDLSPLSERDTHDDPTSEFDILTGSPVSRASGLERVAPDDALIEHAKSIFDTVHRIKEHKCESPIDFREAYLGADATPLEEIEVFRESEPGQGVIITVHKADQTTERVQFWRTEEGRPVCTVLTARKDDEEHVSFRITEEVEGARASRLIDISDQGVIARQTDPSIGASSLSGVEVEDVLQGIEAALLGDEHQTTNEVSVMRLRRRLKIHMGSIALVGFSVAGTATGVVLRLIH